MSARSKVLALATSLLWCTVARAVPAPDVPIEMPQPNGESILVRLQGDEFGLVAETLDGYSLARAADGSFAYAVRGPDGRLTPSGVRPPASPAALGVPRHLRPDAAELARIDADRLAANAARRIHPRLSGAEPVATAESVVAAAAIPFRLAVVPIEFTDVKRTYTKEDLTKVFFGAPGEYRSSPAGRSMTGSLAEYFSEVSYGRVSIVGQVFPWVTAAQTKAYYNTGSNWQLLHSEAIANAGVDRTQFDGFAIIYAGPAPMGGLWPATSGVEYHSAEIYGYAYDVTTIGVLCHELGHALGLRDLYFDPVNAGDWDLMATGSVGCRSGGAATIGITPTHLSAYSKGRLGWISPALVGAGSHPGRTLPPLATSPSADRILSYHSFFLVENRQKIGFDACAPGRGLLVWHEDTTLNQMGLDIEEADGTASSNYGDAGDPFPGTTGKTAFGCATTPSARELDQSCVVEITNVSAPAGATASYDLAVAWRTGGGITVAGAGDYPTLFTAIQSAQAGQTVQVPAGTFVGPVVMKAGVDVLGAGAGSTILSSPHWNAMVIGADSTVLSGVTLQGGGSTGPTHGFSPLDASRYEISNCAFRGFKIGASCSTSGAGAPDVRVVNNVFDGNTTVGLELRGAFTPTVRNNVLVGNLAGISAASFTPNVLTAATDYNDFFGNTLDVNGAAAYGTNNLHVDPLFVSRATGDYRLQSGSPLVNAGDPDGVYLDHDGSRNDLGAFGGPRAPEGGAPPPPPPPPPVTPVTVRTPNGGEILRAGTTYSITWDGGPASFDLAYSLDGGASWAAIGTTTGTSYAWQVPAPSGNEGRVLVRVQARDGSGTLLSTDTSDANFSIEVIAVTRPNGGESLRRSSNTTISWRTSATALPVTRTVLSYSPNAGATWTTITTRTGNPGSYTWRTPSTTSTQCLVKVELFASTTPVGADTSDGVFQIRR